MIVGLHLLYEGKTNIPKGHGESMFYVGNMENPVAIIEYNKIPDYLDDEFYSMFNIWNNGRLTKSLPIDPVWGKNPAHLIEGITTLQQTFDNMTRG